MSFTFVQFQERFPNEDACLQEIWERVSPRWDACPECATEFKYHRVRGRKCYACQDCGHQIFPMAYTPLKETKIKLSYWLFAIYLFSNSKNGVSAKELQRAIGISYPTAHRMGHKIREMMNEEGEIFLTGTVEMDETMMGGRKRGGKRGWGSDRPCVFGMVERGGQIRTVVVPDRKQNTLFPIIVEHVSEDATAYTDEWTGYTHLHREVTEHEKVNHKKYEWVRGDVHTQTIEGAWSLRKRSIKGTYTSVSRKYLQNYLNEFDFRTNHRKENMFEAIMANLG